MLILAQGVRAGEVGVGRRKGWGCERLRGDGTVERKRERKKRQEGRREDGEDLRH